MLHLHCIVLLFVVSTAGSQNYDHQFVGSLTRDLSVKSWRRANGGEFESLFNVYDPSFLSVAWPRIRNGVHLLLEVECWNDVTLYFKELADGKAWAYDVADASGRYSSALFSGARYWLGSKEQCLRMSSDFVEFGHNETLSALRSNEYISSILNREKYFGTDEEEWRWVMQEEVMQLLVAEEHRPPYELMYSAVSVRLNLTRFTMYKSYDITLGVCLPRSCSADDVESLVSLSLSLSAHLRSNRSIPRAAALTGLRQVPGTYNFGEDTPAIVLITISLVLITLAVIATVIDMNLLKCFPYTKKSMSFDLPKHGNELSLVDELKRKHTEIMNVNVDISEANSVAMKKVNVAPSVAVDVSGSCNRCGKYKRQCPNSKQVSNLAACPRVKYSSFASLSTEDKRNTLCCKLLLCFSLTYNLRRIFNKNSANKDLSSVHLVKILATLWIIFVHVAVVASYASNNSGDLNKREDVYYILATGTIAFDTLFFVSGLISSHHLFYLKSRYSVRELVSFGGTCGHIMQFVCFVTNRVIRLVPSYALVVLLAGVVARWARAARALALPDSDHDTCTRYWWRNLLYITTAYPDDEQCLQISWFLSTETQLHALGALACATSASGVVTRVTDAFTGRATRVSHLSPPSHVSHVSQSPAPAGGGMRARLVLSVCAAMVFAAVAADISEAFVQNEEYYSSPYAVYSHLVVRCWSRVAPYFAGVLAGWLVHRTRNTTSYNKVISRLLWTASVSLAASSAWAPRVGAAWASAWLHAAWALALIWPALLLSTKYAHSLRGLSSCVWLSRLSGGMLLTHAVVVRFLLLSDRPLCSDMLCISEYFVWCVCVSAASSLALALLVEMPVCALLRRVSESAAK